MQTKRTVRKAAEVLQAAGIDVRLDEAEFKLGDSLVTKIERGLDSADYVAFFLSNASLRSQWARQELVSSRTHLPGVLPFAS